MTDTNTAPTPDTPAPAPLAPGAESPLHEQMATAGGDGIGTEQFRALVLDGLARGYIKAEQANEELTAQGFAPLTEQELKSPAALPNPEGSRQPAPAAEKLDSMPPGFEGAKAADFTLPDVSAVNEAIEGRGLTPKETMEIHATVGGWMEEAGLPAPIGSAVAKMAGEHIRQMPKWEQMEEGARKAYHTGQTAKLNKLWGRDTAANIAAARAVVQKIEAKRPGLVDFLERTGLGNNANVVAHLAMHGKRLALVKG